MSDINSQCLLERDNVDKIKGLGGGRMSLEREYAIM